MGLQGNIVLLLLGALQAILLTVLLIRKKVYRSGYIFLILYLVTLTAQVLFKVADKYWLMQNVTKSYFLSHYLPLLYGPLAFLFTRNVLSREPKLRSRDLLHFIPFLLYRETGGIGDKAGILFSSVEEMLPLITLNIAGCDNAQ